MFNVLRTRILDNLGKTALVSGERKYSYQDLQIEIEEQETFFKAQDVSRGDVVILIGDFSFKSLARLLALFFVDATVIPLTESAYSKLKKYLDQMSPDFYFNSFRDTKEMKRLSNSGKSDDWRAVLADSGGGLMVFTSGSTGIPKVIIHNIDSLCYRYLEPQPPISSICFLLFDHMGGINTALFLLFRGGTIVHVDDRDTDSICQAIQDNSVALLPTTPSFLSQLLMGNCHKTFDLSSLKVISYGTEVMSLSVLKKLNEVFPDCRFKQTYGLSETGVFQIRSRSNDSLWFKFSDKGVQYKVEDGILWVKTKSNLLAKLIFTNEGVNPEYPNEDWFCTSDIVECDGEYMQILGRATDIINVAGLKVYPSEVENCIFDSGLVDEVCVTGKKHPMIGQMVVANILLKTNVDQASAGKSLKKHCLSHLEKFKVPAKFIFKWDNLVTDRFKKVRTQ
jgi:long-chain acyl-CoA synthetase